MPDQLCENTPNNDSQRTPNNIFMILMCAQSCEITYDFIPTIHAVHTRFHSHDIVVYTPMEINLPLSVFLLDLLFGDFYVF